MDILSSLMGGTIVAAVFTFAQFLITRRDAKAEKESKILKAIAELAETVAGIRKDISVDKADNARRNILLFDDELRRGIDHSEESYNQVLDDIKMYRNFCNSHPDYENDKASSAREHITHCYQQVKAENKFI